MSILVSRRHQLSASSHQPLLISPSYMARTPSLPQDSALEEDPNYIFGGFNFLMWTAFILTIVCLSPFHFSSNPPHTLPAFVQTTWRSGSCSIQSRCGCTSGSYHITSNNAKTLLCFSPKLAGQSRDPVTFSKPEIIHISLNMQLHVE
jgi:hypothetical protein